MYGEMRQNSHFPTTNVDSNNVCECDQFKQLWYSRITFDAIDSTIFFFFSSHYTTPAQCWAQDLARGLNSSRSSWVQGCGRMGQTSRCFMVCSSPHSHVVCPSSFYDVPIRRSNTRMEKKSILKFFLSTSKKRCYNSE